MANTAEEVLEEPYVCYDIPHAKAREWIRSQDEGLLQEAVKLLKKLLELHPHAMQVVPDLALAHLELQDREAARRVLAAYEFAPMALGEEFLCRRGRALRESGDDYVCLDGSGPDKNAALALEHYQLALAQYDAAQKVRRGYYPGINSAVLGLTIHAVTPPDVKEKPSLQEVKKTATQLEEHWHEWGRNSTEPDDHVWRTATMADCHLLREEWDAAAELYRSAQRDPYCRPGHVATMRRTAERIVKCYKRLGREEFGPFSDLDALFPEPETQT